MNYFKVLLTSSLITIIACGEEAKKQQSIPDEQPEQKEALLIGTFHYHNPGADVAKTKSFDILSEKSQQELKGMASDIKAYNPTKVFVEWPHDEQDALDSLFDLYKSDRDFVNDSSSEFYKKNEIFQLAFRVAKRNQRDKVHAIDYLSTKFPFEEVMADIESNGQSELQQKIENAISTFTVEFDSLIDEGASLKELTHSLNTREARYMSNELHNNVISLAGSAKQFNGAFLTAEWYKRNLYMWSLIRKHTTASDQKVMILVGASHAAMFEQFINDDNQWNVKELNTVLRTN